MTAKNYVMFTQNIHMRDADGRCLVCGETVPDAEQFDPCAGDPDPKPITYTLDTEP